MGLGSEDRLEGKGEKVKLLAISVSERSGRAISTTVHRTQVHYPTKADAVICMILLSINLDLSPPTSIVNSGETSFFFSDILTIQS